MKKDLRRRYPSVQTTAKVETSDGLYARRSDFLMCHLSAELEKDMNKTRLSIFLLALVFLTLGTGNSALSALGQEDAVPQALRIDFVDQRTIPEPFSGTWSASGAGFKESGTTQQSFSLSGPWPPATGHIDHLLTSAMGTIHIRSDISIVWSTESFPDHTTEGQFRIISGTGAYEGLHGQGTVSMTAKFTPVETQGGPSYHVVVTGAYVGQANFAP